MHSGELDRDYRVVAEGFTYAVMMETLPVETGLSGV